MRLRRNARVEVVREIGVNGGDHRLLNQTDMEQLVQELRREIAGPTFVSIQQEVQLGSCTLT